MELKSFLVRFWQISNVLRISGVQLLATFCAGYVFGELAVIYGARGCPPAAGFVNYFLWVFAIAGAACTVIGLYYIFFPAIWMQKIERQLLFSNSDLNIPFLSTRPVYVFVDAVPLVPAIVLFVGGSTETMCRFNSEWAKGWAILIMTLLFPVARLFSWYVLKRRIEAKRVRVPWPTLVMWWILTVPAILVATYFYFTKHVSPRARTPVVTADNYESGLKNNPGLAYGIVRVRGELAREINKCGISEKEAKKKPYPFATVLLDMGPGNGQIMVKANTAEQVEELEIEAAGKMGKPVETYGRLSRLPNSRKKHVCGLEKVATAQEGGLALLEIDYPEE